MGKFTIKSVGRGKSGDWLPVSVTAGVSEGIGFYVSGMRKNDIAAAMLRIVTALTSCGYKVPAERIDITVSPVDVDRYGSGLDLPIAVAVLGASGQLGVSEEEAGKYVLSAELGLDGRLWCDGGNGWEKVYCNLGVHKYLLDSQTALQAVSMASEDIYSCGSLAEVVGIMTGQERGTLVWESPGFGWLVDRVSERRKLNV